MTAYVYGLYNFYFKKDSVEKENKEIQQKRQQLLELDNQILKL